MTFISRLPICITLVALLLGGAIVIENEGPQGFREACKPMGKMVLAPFLMGVSESVSFGPLLAAAVVIRRIENRNSEYHLSRYLSLRKHLRTGCRAGLPAISGTQLHDAIAAFCYGHEL